jgi:hypothetical protein
VSDDRYSMADLPLAGIPAGTSVLVAGPTHSGSRDLGLKMLAGSDGEGVIVVTTNRRAARITAECERVGVAVSDDSTAIIDCVGDDSPDIPAKLLPVSSPGDLTGIGMRFSDLHMEFQRAGIDRLDGLGVLVIDPANHDERTVSTLGQFCTGRIDVRDTDDGPELRARGLPDQPREWVSFDPLS